MTTGSALALALLFSGYCVDGPELVKTPWQSASQINVYVSTYSGWELTSASTRADGTRGVNIPLSVVERHVRIAVNILNTLPVELPEFVYQGTTGSLSPPNDSLLLISPSQSEHDFFCEGEGSPACYANPTYKGWPDTFAMISFRSTISATMWQTTATYSAGDSEYDFTGVLLHEILHTLGMLHSPRFSTSECGCGSPQFPTTVCDPTLDARSIMNLDHTVLAASGYPMRIPTRDDIEGLQTFWGTRNGTSGDKYTTYDPAGTWTLTSGEAFGSTATKSSVSSTSPYNDSSREKIGVAFVGSNGFVRESQRSGLGTWTSLVAPDASATEGKAWARPGIAYGNDRIVVLWVDESDKSFNTNGGLPRVRKATKPYSGAFTAGNVNTVPGGTTPTSISSGWVTVGFDPISQRFVMATMGDSGSNSEIQVALLDDNADQLSPFPVGVSAEPDILTIGKPVCVDSGSPNCAIPFVSSPDRATPLVKYALGYVSGSTWVNDTIVSGGYIGYGQVDHAYDYGTGYFSVSWQTLSGRSVIHRRDTITSSINGSAEFNTNLKLPVGLGANQYTFFGSRYLQHQAFIVTAWE